MCNLVCVMSQESYNVFPDLAFDPNITKGQKFIQLFECGLVRIINDLNFDVHNVKHYCHEKPSVLSSYQNLGRYSVFCVDSHLFGSKVHVIKYLRRIDTSLGLREAKNIVDSYPESKIDFLKQEIIEGPFDLQKFTKCIRLNTRFIFDCNPEDLKIVVEKPCIETEDYVVSIYRRKSRMFTGYGVTMEKAIENCANEFKRVVFDNFQELGKMLELLPKD